MGMALSTTRSIAELQAEAERPTLRRVLGPLNLTALGVGSVIGTGIFVLTGTAASPRWPVPSPGSVMPSWPR